MHVGRTTITATEKGERRIKAEEFIKLTRAYGRQVSDFVRSHPKVEPFRVQFWGTFLRCLEDEAKISPYIDMLEELSRNYLELELIVGAPLVRKYPSDYEIGGLRADQAAESVAIEEGNRLGIGDGPIPILRDILKQDVGLRIFYIPMHPSKFSPIYIYVSHLRYCIALTTLHSQYIR